MHECIIPRLLVEYNDDDDYEREIRHHFGLTDQLLSSMIRTRFRSYYDYFLVEHTASESLCSYLFVNQVLSVRLHRKMREGAGHILEDNLETREMVRFPPPLKNGWGVLVLEGGRPCQLRG